MKLRRAILLRMIQQGLCAALLCATALPSHAADGYQAAAVKAAFLLRFAGFVEWPAETVAQPGFTIAVLGDDAVADELSRLVTQRPIQNHQAQVQKIEAIDAIGDAQLLFIGASFGGELLPLTAALASRPVLIVTDREGALDQGSAVNFLLVDRRLRFEISIGAAQNAGLKLGPGLLSVAARVRGGPRSDLACPLMLSPEAGNSSCETQMVSL